MIEGPDATLPDEAGLMAPEISGIAPAGAGRQLRTLTDAEKEHLHRTLAPVIGEWSKTLDGRHLPASQVVRAFEAAVQ